MRIICLTNNKGGVTKTTSTIQIAYGLAKKGYKVLIIDGDPQGNTTYSVLGKLETGRNMLDIMTGKATINECFRSTLQKGLYIVPGAIDLSAADLLLANVAGRERLLTKALKPVLNNYDFILIDTPPTLGMMTVNALVACTDVVIPMALTTYALLGIQILENTMQELRQNLDLEIPVLGVIANLDDHTNINKDILEAIHAHFGNLVFETVIPRNIKVEEAQNQAKSIYDYDPKSAGAIAYNKLVDEFLGRVKQR